MSEIFWFASLLITPCSIFVVVCTEVRLHYNVSCDIYDCWWCVANDEQCERIADSNLSKYV
jgi:hypothetical protein